MKTILLADDHAVVRAGLAAIIKKYTPHAVVTEVGDGIQAIEHARQHKPDLIIMDISMPGLNGLEAISQILKFLPQVRILVLSIHKDKRFVTSAIRLGASGYLLKDGAVEELIIAIEKIMTGRRYLSPALSDIVADELATPRSGKIKSEINSLSGRERQIVSLIVRGARRAEIAKRLHISALTVKTHRKNIMTKLKLHKHSDLVEFAFRHHLGPVPE
ncbi:MAG: response regulator transcription factor [Candidatus Aureabacteria bacterium]|nr:response regulator transcription factor [Candidatus Auribacterota bacterium]